MSFSQRFRPNLARGGFGRGVVTLATGTGIGQIIVILTAPFLTRLYSPTDFGAYAAAASILSILITVACLRYEFAIPLPESDVDASNVLALSLLSAVGTSLIAGLVFWLIGPWLLAQFGGAGLASFVLLIPIGQLGGGVVSAFTSWAVRTKAFSDIAATRITQIIALVIVQLTLGVVKVGAPGLLVGDVVGRVSGSTRLARGAWRTHAESFRQVSWTGIRGAARRYRRFPLFSSGSALLATLGLQLPLLCLVAFYGTDVGGEYALAARIGALPLALVAGAVGQVFVSEAARLAHSDGAAIESLFRRTTIALARTAFLPAVVMAIAAPILVAPIFGASWEEAGLFIAILVPSFYLEFAIGATGDVLYVLERQQLHLLREILRFVLIGGSIPLAAVLGLSATGAVVLLSIAGCVTYGAYGWISWRAVKRHAQLRPGAMTVAAIADMESED